MYLSGLGIYYLKNGQPTSSFNVGDVMGFAVPGYSQVWLDQTQNGQAQYSGPFSVPMAPYTLQSRDVGTFQASVYELTPSGQKGKLIGTDSVRVVAAPAQVQTQTIYAAPTVVGQGAPLYSNVAPAGSGSGLVSTGVPTPTAPAPAPAIVMQAPSGPIDFGGPLPVETPAPGGEAPQQAGFSMLPLLLIAGAGLYFVFGGSKK